MLFQTDKKDLPTPRVPADVDEIVKRFKDRFGRDASREELSHLEYVKKLLAQKKAGAGSS